MADAMRATSSGEALLPLRWAMQLPENAGFMGMMPGCVAALNRSGIKVVNALSENPNRGRSSHTGTFILFDLSTGEALASIDAGELTARRTAATSAMATRVLARPNSRSLAILGAGEQARHHVASMQHVMTVERVSIWNRNLIKAKVMAADIAANNDFVVNVCEEAADAVEGADVVCTVSGAAHPILDACWLTPGMHVNAVGASDPSKIEIDPDCLNVSRCFVDYKESATHQAGEIISKLRSGHDFVDIVVGEIGEVLLGECRGRTSDNDITIYRSLGVSTQDIYAANHIVEMT